MNLLHEILQYYEENLDLEHIQKSKNRIKKTLNYENADRIPLRTVYPCDRFKGFPYSETFNDMEKMMINQLVSFQHSVEVKDDSIPMIRANYGVGTLPSLFGMKCRILNNDLPWVDHVNSEDEIKAIVSRGVPDVRSGLGANVMETQEYYNEQLSKYPKCQKAIPLYHADLQGPFDVAHLIWGSEIYYAVYDNPELVHDLMKLVTETYIKFMAETKKTINDEEDGHNFHWGTLYKGQVVVRDDSPVSISKDMYEEFVRPYDEQILKAFGGGSIHYCGRADQWVFSMMDCKGIEALNFGQPPNLVFEFDFLDKIYDAAREKRLAIIDYIMQKDLVKDIIDTKYAVGISFHTHVSGREEALELLKYISMR